MKYSGKTKRFVRIIKKTTLPQNHLTRRQTKLQYYIGNIGIVITAILALISIFLSVKISKTNTKVDKMDSLIMLISRQTDNQSIQIEELKNIQISSLELSDKMTQQITVIGNQTELLLNTSAPQLSLESITYNVSNLVENEKILSYYIVNTGGRPISKLKSAVTFFNIKGDSIARVTKINNPVTLGNETTLNPNNKHYHYLSLASHKFIDEIIINSDVAISVYYFDPLINKELEKIFYHELRLGINQQLISTFSTPQNIEVMKNYLKKR